MIFHLLNETDLKFALERQAVVSPSLSSGGFIHAAGDEAQAIEVANRLFSTDRDLFALLISESKIQPEIKREAASNGDVYPHIYGAVNFDAVIEIRSVKRDSSGRFSSLEPFNPLT